MKSNKLFNVAGSKERLFEMMQKVNKTKLNEDFINNPQEQNSTDTGILENSFNLLKSNQLKIKQSNTQTSGVDTYVELIGTTPQGVDIVFRFKIETSEGDQDGVISVNDAELLSLISDEINIPEGSIALQQFNAQHKSELIDLISEYADISSAEPELDEEYFKAVEKIDSYPFTSKPRTMVTSQQYGDEKPTNPALRVKSPELNSFIQEDLGVDVNNSDNSNSEIIRKAIEYIDNKLKARGLSRKSMPHDEYVGLVKDATLMFYHSKESGNDFLGEAKKKKKPTGEYPDQIGSHFKPKSDYPVEKKKPTKVVQIDEYDSESNMKMAKTAANSDMDKEHRGANKIPYDTQFSGFDLSDDGSQRGMNNPNIVKFFDKKQHQEHLKYHQMHEGEDEKPEQEFDEPEVEKIEQDREETGEKLVGGLGDETTPQEFDQEQVLMGLKVEMEHSDDPTQALEIVLDHLSEDPEYYTTKDDPEASAQANAAEDAEEKMGGNTEMGMSHAMDTTTGGESGPFGEPDDKEEEDMLLGFKPHNVGDDIEEAYGTPDPLKIPAVLKIGTAR